MNKNTVIALILVAVIMLGFSWYNNEQYEEARKEQLRRDSIALANAPKTVEKIVEKEVVLDTVDVRSVQRMPLYESLKGEEMFYTLENQLMKLTFSNKGGRIAAVQLKDYKKYNGDPLMLFNEDGSRFGMTFFAPEQINTADYYFTSHIVSDKSIAFRLNADSASYIEYLYTIAEDSYMMDFKVDLSHFKGQLLQTQPSMGIAWNVVSPQEEKGFKNENNYTTVAYRFPNESSIEELSMSTGTQSEDISTKVEWVAFKQQFFSSILLNKDNFSNAKIEYNTFSATDTNIKDFNAHLSVPYSPQTDNYNFNFYFGPNKFSILNDYSQYEFQKLIPLGWGIFGWVNRWLVIPTFDFLGSYIANFGIVILLLTIFIKLLIAPLTYKSYLSTAKMRLLKPDIEKINAKYPKKEDAMKKQQAVMGLYKSAGVSPMGGCIPMLIQFPILIAMFRFFPASIELRQKSFLWADDLSSYDSIWTFPDGFSIPFYGDHISLFTVLMAVSLFITSKINYSQNSMSTEQMPGMKFMMLYMMPAMLLFWFNDFSAGLSYYYLLSNLITIGQTYAFRYLVDDNKLHAQMRENSKKPVKKSKWAEKLENMQKQQQAAAKRK